MKLVTRKLFNGECMKKRITLIVFSVLIIVALYVLYCFNYIPHKKYTNADFNIEAYKSNIDKDNAAAKAVSLQLDVNTHRPLSNPLVSLLFCLVMFLTPSGPVSAGSMT